jgi:hypothetical protein
VGRADGAFFGESALVESVTGKGNDYQHRVRTGEQQIYSGTAWSRKQQI